MFKNLRQNLKGFKTYIGIAFGCFVVVVNHFLGPIDGLNLDPANWMADLYTLGLGGFMRAGINNAVRNG